MSSKLPFLTKLGYVSFFLSQLTQIKITKTKLDNIMSVNYYYAYKTLDEVVVEMNKRAQL